jgi:hypothetical protein
LETLSVAEPLEPFVETIRPEECRIGFRSQDGEIVSEIVVSVSLLKEALYSGSSIDLTLSADGFISASLSESTSSTTAPRSVRAIDDLLRSTLTERNLHLEEASACQLRALLVRLEDSVSMVRRAIDHIVNLT